MLKIAAEPHFWATVDIPVPGQEKPVPIHLKFRHMSLDAAGEWAASANEKGFQILHDVVMDWKGCDEEFSFDSLDRLVQNYGGSGVAIIRAYRDELLGARAKN